MIDWMAARGAQEWVCDKIRSDEMFADGSAARVLAQDSQDLGFVINEALARSAGVTVVVAVGRISNCRPAATVELSVICTEAVRANRARTGFLTALEAACGVARAVDSAEAMVRDITQEAVGDGMLVATVRLDVIINGE